MGVSRRPRPTQNDERQPSTSTRPRLAASRQELVAATAPAAPQSPSPRHERTRECLMVAILTVAFESLVNESVQQ